jgi:hypothetical protein
LANMIDIIINATDNATRQIDSVNRAIDRLGNSGTKITGIMTGVAGSIAGISPAVAGIGALASTFASAGIGALAFGAVAVSSIGGVVEASEEIAKIEEKIANADTTEERIKAKQELAQVMGTLSTAEKEALGSLQEFQSWWGGFTSQFDPQVFGVMAGGLDLVRNTMTALAPAITSVGNVLDGFLDKVNNGFKTDTAKRFFDYINESAGSNLQALLTTAGNLFLGFFEILRAFQPLTTMFNAGMVSMSESFLQWSQGLAESKGFQNFVDYALANTPVLISIISNLWGFIVKLVQALAPLGAVVLQVVASFAQWLNTSNLVQTALDLVSQAGQFLSQHMTALTVVLATALAGFLAFKAVVAIVTIIRMITTAVKLMRTAFVLCRTAVLAMNTALLANPYTWIVIAIVAVIAAVVLLIQNWDLVKAKALELWNWLKQAWTGIKQAVIEATTAIIQAVVQWALDMWTKITTMWEQIKVAFQNGVTATVNFFKQLPMQIITAVVYMVGFVVGLFIGFMTSIAQAVANGIQAVVQWFQQLPSRVMAFINSLKAQAIAGFNNMMSMARTAVSNGITAVVNFFQQLPSRVMNFINNLKSQLISGFKNMMDRAKSAVQNGTQAVIQFFSQLPSRVMSFISNLASQLVSRFTSMMSQARSAVSNGISQVVSFFSRLPSQVMSIISSLASQLVSKFTSMMSQAKSAISSGITGMISTIKGFVGDFLSAGKGLLEAFTKGIKAGISKAKSAVESGMNSIREFLPFSPAKKGPLSDLDKSGESFFPTWYEGALKGVRPMERAIGGAMGTMNRALEKDHGQVGLNAFGQSRTTVRQVISVEGTVNVQGDTGSEQVQVVAEQISDQVATFKDLRQAIRKR